MRQIACSNRYDILLETILVSLTAGGTGAFHKYEHEQKVPQMSILLLVSGYMCTVANGERVNKLGVTLSKSAFEYSFKQK